MQRHNAAGGFKKPRPPRGHRVFAGGENQRRRANPSGEKNPARRRSGRRQRQRRDHAARAERTVRPAAPAAKLNELAASLGSDVPFFLQDKPALATGRGEKIQPLEFFPALRGKAFLLIHPGFGISTPWAYQNLARFPAALNGQTGRAQKLISGFKPAICAPPAPDFTIRSKRPRWKNFRCSALFQEFLRANGALAALMSGSGSTTFAIAENVAAAESLAEKFKSKFGQNCWTTVVEI